MAEPGHCRRPGERPHNGPSAAFEGRDPSLEGPAGHLLLPFRKQLLEPPLAAVLIWRDPMAVAESLQSRDQYRSPRRPGRCGNGTTVRHWMALSASTRTSLSTRSCSKIPKAAWSRWRAGSIRFRGSPVGSRLRRLGKLPQPFMPGEARLPRERVHSPERAGEARGGSAASTRWPSAPRELRRGPNRRGPLPCCDRGRPTVRGKWIDRWRGPPTGNALRRAWSDRRVGAPRDGSRFELDEEQEQQAQMGRRRRLVRCELTREFNAS